MLELQGKYIGYKILSNGNYEISFEADKGQAQKIIRNGIQDTVLDLSVKKHREKRSLEANSYFWVLVKKLSDVLNTPKEDIYRSYIKAVGDYTPLPIKYEAVESFINRWGVKGEGWFAEVIDDSKIPGYKLVFAYYGSSTYNTEQMSRIIDMAVNDCKEQGIETLPPEQIKGMVGKWGTAK